MTQEQHDPQTPESEHAPAGHEAPPDGVDAQLDEQIELLKAELEQVRAQSLLERADLENQRKRLAREIDSARRFANERLLSSLVPVFDALEAGLANASDSDPLRAGVELTLRELTRATEASGLATVAPAPGDAFNPEHHQAMSIIEAPGVPAGAVAQVFQKGYLLNERLLRPAMVVVAKAD